jgi:(+)-trans-carveol dehydrogenase
MGTFDGKVAFITGIARAQGRSHALRLANGGADIIGVDIGEDIPGLHYPLASQHDLQETIELIEGTGRRAIIRQADVRDLDSLTAAVNDGVAELGRLDIVVANAGILSLGVATELSDRAWQDVLDVNLTGAWHTAKATVPHIAAGGRGGSIIFISSMAALRPPLGVAHYSASKAGVVALMKTLAAELGPQSIRVNTVNPGTVDTPMIDNDAVLGAFMPELEHPTREDAAKPDSAFVRINALPVPWLEVQDITNAVEFLASDAARLITGVALPIDAGFQVKS